MWKEIKTNLYIIIIIILLLIIAGFAYNQWGKKFSASIKNSLGLDKGNIKILKDDIWIGNEKAPVTIVEYYSYFCGYCKLFEDQTKPRILENYVNSGKAKFVFRTFPPLELGMAVLCANEEGKFLEYHNELFKNAENIQKVDDLKQLAKDIGLDEAKFSECFDSQKYESKTQEWYQQGMEEFERNNIPSDQQGTPSFVINGELLIGAQPYEKFVEVIEKKLRE